MNKLYYFITIILSSLMLMGCSSNESGIVDEGDDNTQEPPIVEGEIAPHPRLLLKKGEEGKVFDLVVKNESFHTAHMYILEYADKVLALEPQTYKLTGKRLLAVSTEVLTRVYFLSYMYRMTGDVKYAARAEKEMLAVAAFKDWNHEQHFLDVGEMTMAVAIGYDWLYDYMSEETKQILRNAIVEKALIPSKNSKWAWFYNRESNWNQVCNGGLVLGALAIYEDEPELAQEIIDKAKETIHNGHACYTGGGAYPEGFSYWGYGTGFEVTMLTAMQTAFGTDYGISNDEDFMNSPYFMLYATAPTGSCYNYSDCGKTVPMQPAMYWFAAKTNNPSLLIYELDYLKEVKKRVGSDNDKLLPNVMIFAKELDLNNVNEPEGNYWVSNGHKPLFIYRSGWNDSSDAFLGVVGGKANQSHGHMDAGSFVYEKSGVRWAMDLGLQSYNSLESQGIKLSDMGQNGQRWEVFRLGKDGHSVIVINGKNLKVDGNPQIDETFSDANKKGAMLDLSSLYSDDVKKVTRTVYLDERNDLHVKDYFETNGKKADVQWMMVTVDSAKKIGNEFMIEKDGKRMLMSVKVNQGDLFPLAKRLENNDEALHSYDEANPGTCRLGYSVTLPANGKYEIEVTLTEIK